ncbi:hypothetical protein ACFVT2_41890 [Streptomyces sp. NPDC058000]|uniref:hypothetical protein n=1 Tax=Streptomyces sp. NPDC058000 TaxID=3346299 RepID=UPI0036EDCB46
MQQATPQDLYREPADAVVARFLGEADIAPAHTEGLQADTDLGILKLTVNAGVARRAPVLLRPSQLRLSLTPGPGKVRTRVHRCHFRGSDHRVELAPETNGLPPLLIAYTDAAWHEGEAYVEIDGPAHPVDEPTVPLP